MASTSNKVSLDSVIHEIGQFGKFQLRNYIFISLPILYIGMCVLTFVFTTEDLNYRCHIPVCDIMSSEDYNPDWLKFAVPYEDDLPAKCERFVPLNVTPWSCNEEYFESVTVKGDCEKFVYETDERNIVNEWNLTCPKNKWKLTIVGTINAFAGFMGLPVMGFLSDKYGRKPVFLFGILCCAFFGTLKSFSWIYGSFLVFEFLENFLAIAVYSTGCILGMELVGPKYRLLGGLLISTSYAIGESILGVIAMFVHNWRFLLRIAYAPGFLFVIYFWTIPESVLWLINKKRFKAAADIIENVARFNGKMLSPEMVKKLTELKESNKELSDFDINNDSNSNDSFLDVFKSKIILFRLINCSFCWAASSFVYTGLSIVSVTIGSNKYESFIYSSLIEIPGIFICWIVAEKFGRVFTLSSSLILSGLSCVASVFIKQSSILSLLLFLIGKFSITISLTILYTYTGELFPTSLRQSLFAVCTMIGRVGPILAPQTPLLSNIATNLPMITFGSVALASGILSLLLPETLNVDLPNTIQEALLIREKKKKKKQKSVTQKH